MIVDYLTRIQIANLIEHIIDCRLEFSPGIHFILIQFRILDPSWKKLVQIRIQFVKISLKFKDFLDKKISKTLNKFWIAKKRRLKNILI